MRNITVYTMPRCNQCYAVKRYLTQRNITHTVINITADDNARATLQALGYTTAPVIEIDGQWHTGFRPELLAGE